MQKIKSSSQPASQPHGELFKFHVFYWEKCVNTVSYISVVTSPPRSEQSCGQSKTREGRKEQEQPPSFLSE